VENFSGFVLIKHVACCVSFFMAACNFHINGRHFTREKSNQFFMRKHSGLIEMKIVYLVVALYSGMDGVCVSDVECKKLNPNY
jgi:hypothetical protein